MVDKIKRVHSEEELEKAFKIIENEIVFNSSLDITSYNELSVKLEEIKRKLCLKK